MFRCLFRVTGAKKPLPAKDRGADDKGCEGRRAQKSLPRIAGDIAFPRRNKGNRLKCGAGRTLPGNEPEGRVTKKGYNRICFRVHLYALICSCNLLKSKTGRRMTASFHAVDRGSNPLGDAKRIIAVILHGSAMQSLRFSFLSFPSRQAVSLLGGVLRLSALPFIFSAHSSHLTA